MHRLRPWLRRHDPEGYAQHRAVRLALAATTVLAISDLLIGDPQVTTFGVFGAFALLLFADFPGSPASRLGAYTGLVVVGSVLVTLGTLLSRSWWAATLGMLVVGTLVAFAGTVSAAIASARNATLLAFILPVTVPAHAAEIVPRLAGWGLAAAVCVPAALLLWPPREHDRLRSASAAVCAALGARLAALSDAQPSPGVDAAFDDLGRALRGTAYRPVTLTTGSRLLLRLADELEWLHQLVRVSDPAAVAGWPPWTRQVIRSSSAVLVAAGDSLAPGPHSPAAVEARHRLAESLAALEAHRRTANEQLTGALVRGEPLVADQLDHHSQRAHAWAYAVDLAGRTVAASAQADARPLLDRLLGRGGTALAVGPATAAVRLATQQAHRDSVWLQSSLRTGVGLALAVLVAQLSHVQHGFWVALGAMSVLRTSAVTTTSTVLRALQGTVVGFVVGGGLVLLAGTGPVTLWVLLPVAILVAGFAPQTVSFAAGQAAFTVAVVILFNILQPVGWEVGLLRVQDVAIGCAAALVVGALLWPGSADSRVRHALAQAYRSAADLLADTVRRTLTPGLPHADRSDAASAALRLDGALRQYLAERGDAARGARDDDRRHQRRGAAPHRGGGRRRARDLQEPRCPAATRTSQRCCCGARRPRRSGSTGLRAPCWRAPVRCRTRCRRTPWTRCWCERVQPRARPPPSASCSWRGSRCSSTTSRRSPRGSADRWPTSASRATAARERRRAPTRWSTPDAMGWLTGLEPATPWTTTRCSTT